MLSEKIFGGKRFVYNNIGIFRCRSQGHWVRPLRDGVGRYQTGFRVLFTSSSPTPRPLNTTRPRRK